MNKIAYVFPGQGSQAVGMGVELCRVYPVARAVFDTADAILPELWGGDEAPGTTLTGLCAEGPEEKLTQTIYTQPALFTTSVATLRTLQALGVEEPNIVAGHSVGEYAALVAAGVLDFETGLHLVTRRAQEMQKAAGEFEGTMAAVLGLEADQVAQICAEVSGSSGIVDPANFNAPGQVVISGSPIGIEAASALAKERGAKRVLALKVSGAFHSRLMAPAAQAMTRIVEKAEFAAPRIPVIANYTGDYVSTAAEARQCLASQVDHSVRWHETVDRMLVDGVETFVEVGHGKVLGGLLKRMAPDALVLSTTDGQAIDECVARLRIMR